MPVLITDLYDGPEIDEALSSQSFTLHYLLAGTTDYEEAYNEFKAYLPTSFLGLELDSFRIRSLGGELWDGVARYEILLDTEITYELAEGTKHVTRSLEVMSSHRAFDFAGSIPDQKGAIGVDNGHVHGIDIGAGALVINIRKRFPQELVTAEYRNKLAAAQYTTNKYTFAIDNPLTGEEEFSYEPGEALFIGAQDGRRGREKEEITLKFLIIKNQENVMIDEMLIEEVRGHWYVDIRFADKTESGNWFKVPMDVYIHRVYEESDFADLFIEDEEEEEEE